MTKVPEPITGVEVAADGEVDEEAVADMEEEAEPASAGDSIEELEPRVGSRRRPRPR